MGSMMLDVPDVSDVQLGSRELLRRKFAWYIQRLGGDHLASAARPDRIGSRMSPLIPFRDPQLLTALTLRAAALATGPSPPSDPIPYPGSPFVQHQLAWRLGDALH